MEQLVILVVIGLISLVNWILQKAAEKRELARMKREHGQDAGRQMQRPPATASQPPPLPRAPAGRPADDPLRELMEALGLPADASPPPPVRSAPVREIPEEEFASLEDEPPPVPAPSRRQPDPSWRQPAPFRPDEATARLASAFNAYEQAPAEAPHATGGTVGVRQLLTGRESQRHAVILAEILGAPRALRPAGEWLPAGAR